MTWVGGGETREICWFSEVTGPAEKGDNRFYDGETFLSRPGGRYPSEEGSGLANRKMCAMRSAAGNTAKLRARAGRVINFDESWDF